MYTHTINTNTPKTSRASRPPSRTRTHHISAQTHTTTPPDVAARPARDIPHAVGSRARSSRSRADPTLYPSHTPTTHAHTMTTHTRPTPSRITRRAHLTRITRETTHDAHVCAIRSAPLLEIRPERAHHPSSSSHPSSPRSSASRATAGITIRASRHHARVTYLGHGVHRLSRDIACAYAVVTRVIRDRASSRVRTPSMACDRSRDRDRSPSRIDRSRSMSIDVDIDLAISPMVVMKDTFLVRTCVQYCVLYYGISCAWFYVCPSWWIVLGDRFA